MESVFSSIVMLLVFGVFITKFVKKANGDERAAVKRQQDVVTSYNHQRNTTGAKPSSNLAKQFTPVPIQADMYAEKSRGGVKYSAKGGTTIKDDRRNDWLAKQMREERQSLYKMASMFGIKSSAGTMSAATLNREYHSKVCDSDGIDTAQGK